MSIVATIPKQEGQLLSPGQAIFNGSMNIEATQSGVFCTVSLVDAAGSAPAFTLPLHMVRVNAHPGTVE